MECDVVIIGAGLAGLAAAAALRRAGVRCTVVEAADRIGGRAWTTMPALLGGAAFDHGASWLHAAERNPLVPLARAQQETLIDTEAVRVRTTRRDGRPASAGDHAAYDAAEATFGRITTERLAGPDVSLAEAVAPVADQPWMAAVVNWEAPIIAAADARALSLRDWHVNLLEGGNLEVAGGLGAFVLRRLGPLAGPVHLGVAARAVAWDGSGVTVQTARGAIRAAACVVTVSTGVLAAGAIAFTPGLPEAVQAAIDGLPMGVLNKVALRASGTDRLGLPDSCGVDQFVAAIDDPAMSFIAWPHGQDHLIGFMGGSVAAALEREGAEAHARAQLRNLFGAKVDSALRPGAVVTRWGSDPFTRGSYAYARPGHAGARAVLAEPLAGGRLVFAGEATRADGLAGTVGGAYLSGIEAAGIVTACVEG